MAILCFGLSEFESHLWTDAVTGDGLTQGKANPHGNALLARPILDCSLAAAGLATGSGSSLLCTRSLAECSYDAPGQAVLLQCTLNSSCSRFFYPSGGLLTWHLHMETCMLPALYIAMRA